MQFIKQLMAPPKLDAWIERYTAGVFAVGVILALIAMYWGLFLTPTDVQQGDIFRIIYIHVPAASLSLGLYSAMTVLAVVYLIWGTVAQAGVYALARIGVFWTAVALLTGILWGKPTWGTGWIWDARLTAELVLLFIYLGIIVVEQVIPGVTRASKIAAVVVLLGSIDLPIVHFSVQWWHTLHQGATLLHFSRPHMAPAMLYPLLLMMTATAFISAAWCGWLTQARLWVICQHKRWVGQRVASSKMTKEN